MGLNPKSTLNRSMQNYISQSIYAYKKDDIFPKALNEPLLRNKAELPNAFAK